MFDETLGSDSGQAPRKASFEVGAADGVTFSIDTVTVSGTDVTLSGLSPTVKQGQSVRVDYTDPSAGDDARAVQDDDGNDAASFALGPDTGDLFAITNGSTVAATAPGKPTGLAAATRSQTEIGLSWNAPNDTGGRAITGYRIEYCQTGCDAATATWHGTSRTKPAPRETPGPTAGRRGHDAPYRVRRSTRIGTGEASDPAVGSTAPPVGTLALSVASASVAEGAALTWTVTATTLEDEAPAQGLPLQVQVATEDIEGAAVAGEDYVASDTTVTFASDDFAQPIDGGPFVATKTGTVATTDDTQVEREEAFALGASIAGGGAGWTVETASVRGAIEDNDRWSVEVTADPAEVVEGETREVTLTARRRPEPGQGEACIVTFGVDVGLAVSGSASGTAPGADYTIDPAPAGQGLSACGTEPVLRWTVSLATVLDAAADPGETVVFTPEVALADPDAGRVPDAVQAATVTIVRSAPVVVGDVRTSISTRARACASRAARDAPDGGRVSVTAVLR